MSHFIINPYMFAATLSQVLSATSVDSATITAPDGISAGDLLVLLDGAWDNGGAPPASVVPSGFTSIDTATTGTTSASRVTMSYKVAAGTEGGTSLTGLPPADGGAAKALYVFRRSPAATSVSLSSPTSQATDGDPAAQTIAASGGGLPLVALAGYSSSSIDLARTFSPTQDAEIGADGNVVDVRLAYKIYNSAPEDITIDMSDDGTDNILQGVYITCT